MQTVIYFFATFHISHFISAEYIKTCFQYFKILQKGFVLALQVKLINAITNFITFPKDYLLHFAPNIYKRLKSLYLSPTSPRTSLPPSPPPAHLFLPREDYLIILLFR